MDEDQSQPGCWVLDRLKPYTWSDEETVAFETAVEAINELIGLYSALIATEENRDESDRTAITVWRAESGKCSQMQRALDPTDHAEVARVRKEIPALTRELRQTNGR